LVTPAEAEMLSLATNQTTIQLVLRNPLDTDIAKTSGSAVAQLLNAGVPLPLPPKAAVVRPAQPVGVRSAPSSAAPPPPKPRVVEVIHGIKRTDTRFDAPEEVKP